MTGQLDLFSGTGAPASVSPLVEEGDGGGVVLDMTDQALIDALLVVRMSDTLALIAEAGRRRLRPAVSVLEQLCRRFAGFGEIVAVPEQVASLNALAQIGGTQATRAVIELIAKSVVAGPNLVSAVDAATRLDAILPADIAARLLRHDDPMIRALTCRCAPPSPAILPLLIELLEDLHPQVSVAAACALGRMGSAAAKPFLLELLRNAPSQDVIDAVSGIADDQCVVLLARIVRTIPALADAANDVLMTIDDPKARALTAAYRTQDT